MFGSRIGWIFPVIVFIVVIVVIWYGITQGGI